jgi:regulator of protease activity HflC (stomatin/prohibitin superfamily)
MDFYSLSTRNEIGKKVSSICELRLEEMGLKLHVANIKDIMFPGELKKVFSKVVEAQKEGLAILEKARGETAALRQLANAAKLLEDNPYLMQLRMLQSTGHTFIIGSSDKTIIPTKPQD